MKKTCILFLVFLVLLAGIYALYAGDNYIRQQLQIRFAETHALLSDEDSEAAFDDNTAKKTVIDASAADIIPWKLLAAAEMGIIKREGKEIAAPHYPDAIKALNHKEVKVHGYIFPLEQSGKQRHFLLSPYPPSCPYCLPAGPSELIDVWLEYPVEFTYEAITVKGMFELLEKDEDIKSGMFYRLSKGKAE